MGYKIGSEIVIDGLVFCVDAADKNSYPGSGTALTDVATSNSGVTLSNADIGTLTPGVFDFAGNASSNVTRYIDTPDTIGYTTEVSCFVWAKRTTNTGVAGNYHIVVGDAALEMSFNISGTYLRNGVSVNSIRYVANDGSAIGTNTWHYCGITYTNYTKKSYVDGVLQGTQTCGSGGNLDHSMTNRRFGRYGTLDYALVGQLGPIQIYNRVLSVDEVRQNFNAQKQRFGL
tara:strand:- start:31 stop:720 length:690 start_codon:yes stop_codon:yes gene_type:complete